ncbi:unnamed protein product [Mytilus edulis]|uniref:AIG1-type G domain-containing protein n=1 Tax=Mytilus edulis TaxID=6550 RepID=A0A8S3TKD2_MYTED|nr:unnamed protein product [Mytilus edulis]
MVLVGRTGSGISASGNSLLKHVCFHSDSSASSVTKTCCIETTERDGKIVKVVDTPGLFGNIMTVDEIKREILNCFALLSPGPHAIVYVLRIGRFTNEEIQGVQRFYTYLIAEDERTCVENKHDKTICIPPYFKQIAGGSVVLATGMACFGISPTLLPFVGAGIVGIGVSKYYNGLSKPNDELRIVLEEIKEDSRIQCTIS